MNESSNSDPLARSIRRLTIVVAVLAAILLAQVLLYAVSMYRSANMFRGTRSAITESPRDNAASRERDFFSLPPEEMIRRSAAILLTTHKQENGRMKAIVSEILKKPTSESLRYSVGDELIEYSHYDGNAQTNGDGEVVFLRDSSGSASEAMPYRNGRITGLADMPLEILRAIAAGGPASSGVSRVSPPAVASPSERSHSKLRDSVAPSGEMVTLQTVTNERGESYKYAIPRSLAETTPRWRPSENGAPPPLSFEDAVLLATEASRRTHAGAASKIDSISLHAMSCQPEVPDRWYYMVALHSVSTRGDRLTSDWQLLLLNGDVVTPTREPEAKPIS